jgi:hypothetical protein
MCLSLYLEKSKDSDAVILFPEEAGLEFGLRLASTRADLRTLWTHPQALSCHHTEF